MTGSLRVIFLSKRALFFAVLMFIGCGLLLAFSGSQALITVGNFKRGKATVIIDPGHGGVDSGAKYGNMLEKNITLDVALRVREYLIQKGIDVQLTRESDVDLGGELTRGRHLRDLQARLQMINRGQIAVSIHVNTTRDYSEKGAIVFCARDSKNGRRLAEKILEELGKVQELNNDHLIPTDNLYLLRRAEVPLVLVELGFISNWQDRAKLDNETFRQKCAQAIAQGVINFLENPD